MEMAGGRVSGVLSAIRELPSIIRVLYYNRLLQGNQIGKDTIASRRKSYEARYHLQISPR